MIWLIIIAAIIIVLYIISCDNRKKAAEAFKALKVPGDLIKAPDGATVHGALMGEGKYTIVMLSGWGTACPYADFHIIWEKLIKHCKVLVLEVPGYGFAPETDAPRTLENYDAEITAALDHFGIKDNVILMPHSYSGIMTFYYAKKHPDVVKALFNDDASTWHQVKYKTPGWANLFIRFLTFAVRNFGRLFHKSQLKAMAKENLTGEYAEMFLAVQESGKPSPTQLAEHFNFEKTMEPLVGQKYDEGLHVVNMLASEQGKSDEIMKKATGFNWQEAHEDLVSNPAIQKIAVMEGAQHYIHHTHSDQMEKLAVELIEELEKSA